MVSLNKLYDNVCIVLFQSVNKFSILNITALRSFHSFVTWTSMTACDHNFNSQG